MKFKSEQEVCRYLKNSKIYVNGKSAEIQKILFKYHFVWKSSRTTYILNCDSPFIYTYDTTFADGSNMSTFNDLEAKEIKVEDILSIEVEKDIYDPNRFKPFDRVLMCKDTSCWNPEFFKCYRYGGYDERGINVVDYMSITGDIYTHCIPYKGNEDLAFQSYHYEDKK